MKESLEAIVLAIEGLHSNPIKDYILPVGSLLTSAALGIGVAYYSVNRQEKNRIEIQNIDAINEVILSASGARNNLIAIKSNYFKTIGNNPFQRILSIPPIIMNSKAISLNISQLSFIAPSTKSDRVRWESIEYIESLFKNYNYSLSVWNQRNELMLQLLPHVMQFHGHNVSLQQLEQAIGRGTLAQLSDITEQAIMLTDDLLVEISCFLQGFPDIAQSRVCPKVSKKFRRTLKIELPDKNTSPEAVDLMSLVPELDYTVAGQLHLLPANEVKYRYRRLYLK
ncbi:hypothetical protein ACGB6O_001069 [Vibrio parahaemolyticus]|nr:hypothetical protein [Vibrio parahaemolyticus]